MSHASRILAQLKQAEDDEELPDELRKEIAERADELADELEGEDGE